MELVMKKSALRVRHLSPESLKRYALQLERGFLEIGVASFLQIDPQSPVKEAAPPSISLDTSVEMTVTLAELHASSQEIPVDPSLYSENTVLLIHRPEEFLLRFSKEEKRKFLGIDSGNVKVIVLLGKAFIPRLLNAINDLFPGNMIRIVDIPHGFFSIGDIDSSFLRQPSRIRNRIAVVGSVTTWGDMRFAEDAINFVRECRRVGSEKLSGDEVLGYISGKFDAMNLERVNQLAAQKDSDILLLDSAMANLKGVSKLSELKAALFDIANGKILVNTASSNFELFTKLEESLIDFNVQFYREVLNYNLAKVEYSGTIHLRANWINVVLVSPSMDDLARDEGVHFLSTPIRSTPGLDSTPIAEVDFVPGAKKVVELIANPTMRMEMLQKNVAGAQSLQMKDIARRYVSLFHEIVSDRA